MKVHNFTASKRFKLEGLNQYYHTAGEEGDISHFCVVGFFSFIVYQNQAQVFLYDKWWLGLYLGPADSFGNFIAQWVLGPTMIPLPQRIVCALSEVEKVKPEIIKWKDEILQNACKRFRECLPICQNPKNNIDGEYYESYRVVLPEESGDCPEENTIPEDCLNPRLDNNEAESPVNMLINAEVMLISAKDDSTSVLCCVRNCSQNKQGEGIGDFNENPLLNTQVYDIEDVDGNVLKYSANIIAQNIYDTCDHGEIRWNTVNKIVGHNQSTLR